MMAFPHSIPKVTTVGDQGPDLPEAFHTRLRRISSSIRPSGWIRTSTCAHKMISSRRGLSSPVLALTVLLGLATAAHAQTELREGSAVGGSLAEGDTARYSVVVGEDYYLFGVVDQISADVVIRVLNADGSEVARADGPARGAEKFARELDEAGTYTIQVIPLEDGAGDYEILLHRVEPIATDPEKLADQLMARYDGDDTPGAAIQVWRDGRTLYSESWGMANLAYDMPFETDTRTNIGSTSKQFTAFAVMLEAERGALALDDDIRMHIPELPDFGEPVTVRHLLTHTSGLREIFNLLVMAGRRIDHGDYIGRDEVIEVVQAQPALQNSPGVEWNYNNTAFALAAMIVEKTSGRTFPEYMEENVFGPLGMTGTMVRAHAEAIVPNYSQGYLPADQGYTEARDLSAAVGAGAIYSTVGDLQRWVENYSSPNPVVGTPEIFEQMMTSYVLSDGEETGYGYGLMIDEQGGQRRVHHGGADIAHRSMLAYYPELNAGITTQSNHASFDSGVAFRLAEAFFSDAIAAEGEGDDGDSDFDPASYDAEDFDEFVGRYAIDAAPNFILSFFREDDTFYTQATGQQQIEIVPTSDSTFVIASVNASIVFHRNEEGQVDALTLNQNGQQRATRLPDDEDEAAWEPTSAELEDFVGRYFSEELQTFYDFVVEEVVLIAQQHRLDDIALSTGDEDRFVGNQLNFTFERDRNGLVIGFYLDNVRTRDVRFERVR